MARIKFSAIGITNILGKAGGTVFSRNRGGAYFKNFVVPSNPSSTRQQTVRSFFALISSLWRSLEGVQREQWNSSTENYPQTNKFGDTFYLSGKGLFQKLNGNLLNVGVEFLSVPRLPTGSNPALTMEDSEIIHDSGDLTTIALVADFAEIVTGVVAFDATRIMPKGKIAQATDYRRIGHAPINAADTVTFNTLSAYTSIFGEQATTNDVIFVRCSLIVASGEKSAYTSQGVTVTSV